MTCHDIFVYCEIEGGEVCIVGLKAEKSFLRFFVNFPVGTG